MWAKLEEELESDKSEPSLSSAEPVTPLSSPAPRPAAWAWGFDLALVALSPGRPDLATAGQLRLTPLAADLTAASAVGLHGRGRPGATP